MYRAQFTPERLELLAAVIFVELSKYPVEMLAYIRKINVIHKLKVLSKDVDGSALKPTEIFLQTDEITNREVSPETVDLLFRQLIHHEIMHQMEQAHLIESYDSRRDWPVTQEYYDYLDSYSRSYETKLKVAEDIATVGAFVMMGEKGVTDVSNRERTEVLQNKINIMRGRLMGWSNNKMNLQFFNDLADGNVKVGYWDDK